MKCEKNIIVLSIIITVFHSISLFSQSIELSSAELINCTTTGYTNVITLNWVDSDTVIVSRSKRTSFEGDETRSYFLASLNNSVTENEISLNCEDNTWIIPFNKNLDPAICLNVDQITFTCQCPDVVAAGGACEIQDSMIGDFLIIECEKNSCSTCCEEKTVLTNHEIFGSIVILNATKVIFDF